MIMIRVKNIHCLSQNMSFPSASLLSPVLPKLEVLDLSYNRIQAEGAANLGKCILESELKLHTLGKFKVAI